MISLLDWLLFTLSLTLHGTFIYVLLVLFLSL